MKIGVGGRVVEAEADVGELVGVHAGHDRGLGGVFVFERLHLGGEGGTEIELESALTPAFS
jgi:hypothetical protein